MKWVLQAFIVWCLANLAHGGVLKCTPVSEDPACKGQTQDLVPDQPIQASDSAKESTEAECQAGSEWESNCHYCRCSVDGVAECLKQDTCAAEYGEPILCKPNTTFLRECNTCICLESGLGLCTVESCLRTASPPPKVQLPRGRACLPDTFWKSKCNDCGCSPEGEAYCTKKACPGLEAEPDMGCAPDTIWKNDCNTCWCTSNGHAMCTKIGCIQNFNYVSTTPRSGLEDLKSDDGTTPQIRIDDEDYLNSLQTEPTIIKLHEAAESSGNPKNEVVKVENIGSLQEGEDKINTKVENYEVAHESEKEPNANNPNEDIELIHNVQKRSSTCKPHEDFQIDCNSCKCSADGQSYSCTQNECMDKNERDMTKEVEVFMESEGVDHIERHSVCKPRGTFFIGCNTCHCNYDGTDYSCTNKPCPLPEDVELFHELRAAKAKPTSNSTKAIVCVANRMFIMDCNTCWCNEDGTSFFCTRKVCIPEDIDEETDKPENLRIIKKDCRPDEVFELDCNMCRCNPDGKSFSCTRRACAEQTDSDKNGTVISRRVRQVSAKEIDKPKQCQPGKEFRLDCNKCLCDDRGEFFSCTRIDCSAPNTFPASGTFEEASARAKREAAHEVPAECTPGSVYDQECNVCRCTKEGKHAMCTMNRCPKPQDKTKPQEAEGSAPATESTFRCNPGESYKSECNDCSCSADGQSLFCTLRYCD